jgi:predicted DNA-binding protein
MDPFADIDLDSEAVWLDGAWYTRDELARRIKQMIESGDFRVSRPSQALERLEAALGQAQVLAVRMPADLAAAASATATRLGRPVGHLVREAIAYYLAAAAAYGASQAAARAAGQAPAQPAGQAPTQPAGQAPTQPAAPASALPSVDVDLEGEAPGSFFKKAR